jgi:Vertebrate endogenous opioids neuropeptide
MVITALLTLAYLFSGHRLRSSFHSLKTIQDMSDCLRKCFICPRETRQLAKAYRNTTKWLSIVECQPKSFSSKQWSICRRIWGFNQPPFEKIWSPFPSTVWQGLNTSQFPTSWRVDPPLKIFANRPATGSEPARCFYIGRVPKRQHNRCEFIALITAQRYGVVVARSQPHTLIRTDA